MAYIEFHDVVDGEIKKAKVDAIPRNSEYVMLNQQSYVVTSVVHMFSDHIYPDKVQVWLAKR
ncbi:hypothetical protein KGP36_07295 [Patescibacteria group bacterium]|nr:hypothetical protein [Patescibacteria group bacterium]